MAFAKATKQNATIKMAITGPKGKIKDLIVASGKSEQAVKYILGDRAKEIFGDSQNAMDGDKESE